VNRVDEIVVFHPLDREQLHRIAEIQVQYVRSRLQARDMDLELSASALDQLAKAGFDPVYGARPLKRAIQQFIENPLAQEILAGKFAPKDVIVVEAGQNALEFKKKSVRERKAGAV
jgi:ATP-dependent Clp protease ATP-binding subunit ClpB